MTKKPADLDLSMLPDVDGVPFTDAFAAHFAPLSAYEAQYGPFTPKRVIEAEELLRLAGLEGKTFARERGMWIGRDDNGNGPYLVIHTRNGGGNREHWDDDNEPGIDCGCTGCVQSYLIPTYPGFVYDRDDDFDSTYANNYFTIPELPEDVVLPGMGDENDTLMTLDNERKLVLDGKIVPWFFLPENEAHGQVLDDYRRPYVSGFYSSSNPRKDVDAKRKKAEELSETLRETREAYDAAEPITERPATLTRPKTGARGQKLRTREPIPVRPFLVEHKHLHDEEARQAATKNLIADLERIVADETLAESTRTWLTDKHDWEVKWSTERASENQRYLDEARYRYANAYLNAPREMDQMQAQIDALNARADELEANIERAHDSNWRTWPNDDHDAYLVARKAFIGE